MIGAGDACVGTREPDRAVVFTHAAKDHRVMPFNGLPRGRALMEPETATLTVCHEHVITRRSPERVTHPG
ncbi:hypothetical protein BSTAB16_4008 [Burkholderia stabilis]|uniref:Uncharacterized protein n=1 Tax=Burkholderia stabilis TaxID=95485 RepID=A0AAJ5NDN6_9BURK|nr:hypothetical protein BSTAB16_4008 [Burkholderia stabilis]